MKKNGKKVPQGFEKKPLEISIVNFVIGVFSVFIIIAIIAFVFELTKGNKLKTDNLNFIEQPTLNVIKEASTEFTQNFTSYVSTSFNDKTKTIEKFMSFNLLKSYKQVFENDKVFTNYIVDGAYKTTFTLYDVSCREISPQNVIATVIGKLVFEKSKSKIIKEYNYKIDLNWIKQKDGVWVVDDLYPEMKETTL